MENRTNKLGSLLYAIAGALGLAYGIAWPGLASREGQRISEELRMHLIHHPFLGFMVLMTCVVLSGVTMYVAIHATRKGPTIISCLFKLGAIALLAIAAGSLVALAMGWLGVYQAAAQCYVLLTIAAANFLAGGAVGLASMKRTAA